MHLMERGRLPWSLVTVPLFLLVLLLSAYSATSSATCQLWVDSNQGSDLNNGTLEFPLETLDAALEYWRKRPDETCTRLVQLSPGQYLNPNLKVDVLNVTFSRCTECPHGNASTTVVELILEPSWGHLATFGVPSSYLEFKDLVIRSSDSHGSMVTTPLVVSAGTLRLTHVEWRDFLGERLSLIVVYSNLIVVDSVFADNKVTSQPGVPSSIIFGTRSSNITIRSSKFQRNYRLSLPGDTVHGACLGINGELHLEDSEISDTTVDYYSSWRVMAAIGGAVYIDSARPIRIIGTSFLSNIVNTAQEERSCGGAVTIFSSNPRYPVIVDRCFFANNSANYGAAIGTSKDANFNFKTMVNITRSAFENNTCTTAGCAVYGSNPRYWLIADSRFIRNRLVVQSSLRALGASALYFQDLIYDNSPFEVTFPAREVDSVVDIIRCHFEDNAFVGTSHVASHTMSIVATLKAIAAATIRDSTFAGSVRILSPVIPVFTVVMTYRIEMTGNTFFNNPCPHLSVSEAHRKNTYQPPVCDIDGINTAPLDASYALLLANNTIYPIIDALSDDFIVIAVDVSSILVHSETVFTPEVLSMLPSSPGFVQTAYFLNSNMKTAVFYNVTISIALPSASSMRVTSVDNLVIDGSSFKNPIIVSWTDSFHFRHSQVSTQTGPAISAHYLDTVCVIASKLVDNRAMDGGAALRLVASPATITGSVISRNNVLRRGAVESDSQLVVEDCQFDDNAAGMMGAALFASSNLVVRNSSFSRNHAPYGGAIVTGVVASIVTSRFSYNEATQQGGAIWVQREGVLFVRASFFDHNQAQVLGGAIYLEPRTILTIYGTTLSGNQVPPSSLFPRDLSWKGVEYRDPHSIASVMSRGSGGALSALSAFSLKILYCRFENNLAAYGGHIHLQGMPDLMTISWTTFFGGKAPNGGSSIALQPDPDSSEDSSGAFLTFTAVNRVIDNCQFEETPRVYTPSLFGMLYWIPCDDCFSVTPYITTISNSVFIFHAWSSAYALAAYASGPPQQYFDWALNNTFILSNDSDHSRPGPLFFYYVPSEHSNASFALKPTLGENSTFLNFGPHPAPLIASTAYSIRVSPLVEQPYCDDSSMLLPNSTTSNRLSRRGPPTWNFLWSVSKLMFLICREDLYQNVCNDTLPDGSYPYEMEFSSDFFSSYHDPEVASYWGNPRLSLTINASNALFDAYPKPTLYSKRPASNPLDSYRPVSLTFFVNPSDPLVQRFISPNTTLTGYIGGCDVGEGLHPHPLLPNTFTCSPCPFGTYNLNGDGRCYLCNDPESSYQPVSCEGCRVWSQPDYFVTGVPDPVDHVREPTPSGGSSSDIWVHKCNYRYCNGHGMCQEGREGFLCGACRPGYSESLAFSICLDYPLRAYSSAIILLVALPIVGLIIHALVQHNFGPTLAALFFTQQVISFPRQLFSSILPTLLSTAIIERASLGQASALDRATIFAPFFSILAPVLAFLPTAFVVFLYILLKSVRTRVSPFSNDVSQDAKAGSSLIAKMASFGGLHSTLCVLFMLCITPLLQTLVELGMCLDTPAGSVWLVAPSIRCNESSFLARRSLLLGTGIPALLFAISFTVVSFAKPTALLEAQLRRHFKSEIYARAFIALLLLSTALTGLSSSLSYWNYIFSYIFTPLILLAYACGFTMLSSFASRFFSYLTATCAFVAFCLAILARIYVHTTSTKSLVAHISIGAVTSCFFLAAITFVPNPAWLPFCCRKTSQKPLSTSLAKKGVADLISR